MDLANDLFIDLLGQRGCKFRTIFHGTVSDWCPRNLPRYSLRHGNFCCDWSRDSS